MAHGKIVDPICDMVVDFDEARAEGLTLDHAGREYGFCSASCQQKFAKDPSAYIPKVEAWLANGGGGTEHAHGYNAAKPTIDAGIRAWYESCRCCLSDAHPQIVEVLDRERAAKAQAPADAGICETAESHKA
ncbi:MAG: YHS domain-containing protein [Chloroflexota bacterium]|nr:YHS domain-containing protein [Chloroflexota bacterium]